jgi:hypothetical protein
VKYTTPVILPGSQWAADLAVNGIAPAGFSGYIIADCDFRNAHGFETIIYNDGYSNGFATSVPALVLVYPRPAANESLGQ